MPSVAQIIRHRRVRRARKKAQRRRRRIWAAVLLLIPTLLVLLPLLAALGLAAWLYAQAASHLPPPAATIHIAPQGGAQFYDRSRTVQIAAITDPLGEERRWLKLEELPPPLITATLLVEDRDYLQTARFDPLHALLQIWRYILGAPIAAEPSISGRLVRNVLLPAARSSGLDDRLLEIALIAESERRWSAESLLEWHLNTNDYGRDAYGIQAAAARYLGKSAGALSLDEAVLLAAIPSNPRLNPIDSELAARNRQADLLHELYDSGLIDKAQFDRASTTVTALRMAAAPAAETAPHFVAYARQQAQDILDGEGLDGGRLLARGGLQITTTLDRDLHFQAECTLRRQLEGLDGGDGAALTLDDAPCIAAAVPPAESAAQLGTLLLLDVGSGEILSMVGDATAVSHQPSRLLHPFVYAEGFLQRLVTPASMVYDVPRAFPGPADGLIYSPVNADGRFRGPLNLRDAMAAGLLPPVVAVAEERGIAQIIRTAHQIGLNSLDENRYGLEVLERGGAVSVLDAAYAYSVFAALGVMHGLPAEPIAAGHRGRSPVAVLSIRTADGQPLWEYDRAPHSNQTTILEPSLAYLVNDILSDAALREQVLGVPQTSRQLSRPAAVLSGLSADGRDDWAVGYTPQLALAVHLGRADAAAMRRDENQGQGAAPVWRTVMDYAHEAGRLPVQGWQRPADVEEYLVCDISGLLPTSAGHCPTRLEVVPAGSLLPTDTFWQTYEINTQTGQLATANTPDDLREERVYFVPPDAALEWWLANDQPLPPSDYDTDSGAPVRQAVQIDEPQDFAYVGGAVAVRGSINAPDAASAAGHQLSYGQGVNPREWFAIESRLAAGIITGSWDTTALNGVYTLRLSADFADGSSAADTKLVSLDNIPPMIELRTSSALNTIAYPQQTVVSLVADASDNLTIERVEFYHNDTLLGIDREWLYGFEYEISQPGTEVFRAQVFDRVGNTASADLTVQIVRQP